MNLKGEICDGICENTGWYMRKLYKKSINVGEHNYPLSDPDTWGKRQNSEECYRNLLLYTFINTLV